VRGHPQASLARCRRPQSPAGILYHWVPERACAACADVIGRRCAIRNSKLHETPCVCIDVCSQGVLFLRMFVHV